MNEKDLYQSNGYFNAKALYDDQIPFIFVVGGRGTGKTYNTLQHAVSAGLRFMYLRRKQSQTDLVFSEAANVFKPINDDFGYNIRPHKVKGNKYLCQFCDFTDEEQPVLKGYGAALSTFYNLRSVDLSDVEVIILDEFAPEHGERPIKAEGETFLNMIETVGRNRELSGRPPVKVICLANSNDMGNELFMQLGLVVPAEELKRSDHMIYTDRQRGVMLIQLEDSEISNAKKETALYKLAGEDSDFSKMALGNEYQQIEYMNIRKLNRSQMREYRPLYKVGELAVYIHKKRKEYYICTHESGAVKNYGTGELAFRLFARENPRLWIEYNHQHIYFESYYCERIFTNIYI